VCRTLKVISDKKTEGTKKRRRKEEEEKESEQALE
jgi:hypothetical protein